MLFYLSVLSEKIYFVAFVQILFKRTIFRTHLVNNYCITEFQLIVVLIKCTQIIEGEISITILINHLAPGGQFFLK